MERREEEMLNFLFSREFLNAGPLAQQGKWELVMLSIKKLSGQAREFPELEPLMARMRSAASRRSLPELKNVLSRVTEKKAELYRSMKQGETEYGKSQ